MQKPEIVSENGVMHVCPGPEYDSIYEDSIELFDDVFELTRTVEPPLMIMDLTHTNYCGSAFLGLLLRFSNRLAVQRNGRFGVCHLSKYCKAVISKTKMDQVIDVFDTRADAVAALTNGWPESPGEE